MCIYSYCCVCSVLGILFYWVALCIVCVLICIVLLPPGVNPTAVNKYHIINIDRHELGLDRPVSPRLLVSSKVFQVAFVHLVYNSALFLSSCCCSFLLHVIANLICIVLVSRQLVLLSTHPKFIHSFCGQKGYTRLFWKI